MKWEENGRKPKTEFIEAIELFQTNGFISFSSNYRPIVNGSICRNRWWGWCWTVQWFGIKSKYEKNATNIASSTVMCIGWRTINAWTDFGKWISEDFRLFFFWYNISKLKSREKKSFYSSSLFRSNPVSLTRVTVMI